MLRLLALVLALAGAAAAAPTMPHIVHIMVDDYGYASVGYHAKTQPNSAEVVTPNIDALAAEGIILDRFYAYRFCSPSRSSFLTGRNPIHVNTGNDPLTLFNAKDPVSGFAGIPRNMSTIANKLSAAGYNTVQAGKWHVGLATPDHTPKGRGFRHSLTYLDGANDYFTSTTTGWCDTADPANGVPYTDLWASAGPALGRNNSWSCSQTHQPASCVYEDALFTNFTVAQILAHDAATPLFLYFAPHNVHEPLEAPQAQLDAFAFVYDNCAAAAGGATGLGKNNSCDAQLRDPAHPGDGKTIKQCCFRQYYSAMTNLVDQHIGQVVGALKAKGMWANTFLSLSSDNGGPIYRNGAAGGNNFPLRGGKKSNFEGGVRVNALVSGGLLPAAARGSTLTDLMAMEDLYATYCALAGVEPADARAAAAGLPPVDGLNLWPLLSGANASAPRAEVWLGSGGAGDSDGSASPIVQGYIRADGYKVLYGSVIENTWTGPFYPNATTNWCDTCPLDCGTLAKPTCLFNVLSDPTEHDNVASAQPAIVKEMAARLAQLTVGLFAPDRGQPATDLACKASADKWSGFVGPFAP